MGRADSDRSEEFPVERGKKPGLDFFGISDLLLVLRQDKESFLCKVSGLALIFCQRETKPVKSGMVF
jgi:hypothetical protein